MDRNKIIFKILQRREIKKKSRDEKVFESTSMGDMAFLLLIFFIVTGSFILRQGIFFSMPSNSSGLIRLEAKEIFEVHPKNDGFLHNSRLLSREKFSTQLAQHKKNTVHGVLMIKMQKNVKYDRLVDTLSVAKETGVTKVSLKNAGE